MPISPVDLANATANEAARDVRFIKPTIKHILAILEKHGLVETCGDCQGAGCIRPAYGVPCKRCGGSGKQEVE